VHGRGSPLLDSGSKTRHLAELPVRPTACQSGTALHASGPVPGAPCVRFLADCQSSLYDERMYGSSFVGVGVLFSVSLLVHNLRSHSVDRTEPSKLDEPAAMFQPSTLDESTKPKIEKPDRKSVV